MKKSIVALALAAALPVGANAMDAYVGASVGYADIEETTFGNCSGCINDDDVSWGLLAGVQLTDILAVELGYTDFGSYKSNDGGEGKLDSTAITISAVGQVPVAKGWNVFGRVGIAYLDNDFHYFGQEYTDHSQDLLLGGGISWEAMPNLKVRLEETWYNAEDTSQFNNLSLQATYSFKL